MFGFCEREEEPKSKTRNMIRTISDSNMPQPEENKSAQSEKTKTEEQFKQEHEIDALWRFEMGFS